MKNKNRFMLTLFLSLFLIIGVSNACQPISQIESIEEISTETISETGVVDEPTEIPTTQSDSAGATRENALEEPLLEETAASTITIDLTDTPNPINPLILGSNVPAWLANDRLDDPEFQARTLGAGVSLIRLPGGSWSNYYDWLACERGGEGIDETAECYWTWAARPTDFINFLRDTGLEGIYTINMNGTTKEAAALVAFFNGAVDDDNVIGVDVRGRDWGKVSDWAQLRSVNGNPEPIGIRYYEIGNEIFGGTQSSGADCTGYGWEEVWTCDGAEYVNGIGSGANQKEGFLEYREAMRAVDQSILVGAVGVAFQNEWSNWGNEVIVDAGNVMDFYIIHHYGFNDSPSTFAEALAQPHNTWPAITADVRAAFDQHAGGREVPIAITEYNLFSIQELDNGQLMTRLLNALYMADTVGQMISSSVDIATQWDLANGQPENGTDYGLVDFDTYEPYPQYFAYTLWSRFGSELLPAASSLPADTTLSVYAGRIDENTISILAINKTADPLPTTIQLENGPSITGALADVLTGDSLEAQTITFNGQSSPDPDFANAPSLPLEITDGPFSYTFASYSVTLLRLSLDS
ncbi:MAG: alpha-L-arabinofuranosidase [Anaerolineaceae bacterium]|nr:alpha-L-arabinofuranosidase [Anaerolineaceae bacterium]